MRYDLAQMAQRQGLKRQTVVFSPIEMTGALTNGLAAISHRMLAPWYGSKSAILDLYARELAARLRLDAADEMSSLFDQLGGEISRLIFNLDPELQNWAMQTESWHRGKWSRSVLAGTSVDIATIIGPADAQEPIQTFMARQTALIRNVSDTTRGKISDIVFAGLQQRVPARDVGREISTILDSSRQRANRIAADQAVKLASALDAQRQREAGLDVWQWNHSGKLHFRPAHKARNGNWYADDAKDRGIYETGKNIAEPPIDLPGQLPFCGCIRQGLLLLGETAKGQVAAPPTPKPKPKPVEQPVPVAQPQKGFVSPVNREVNAGTIKVQPRLKLQKVLSAEFKEAAGAFAYQPRQEFRSRVDSDFGKASFGAGFDDQSVSMIAALKPELDHLADQIGIPRLRGFKTGAGSSYVANQGDGVMQLSPQFWNAYAARVGGREAGQALGQLQAKMDALKDEMQPLIQRLNGIRDSKAALDTIDPQYRALWNEERSVLNELNTLRGSHDRLWRKLGSMKASSESEASSWKPGDDPKARPYTMKQYYADGVDQARSTLFHEFGHHVHQYLNREGPRRQFGTPPLERELITYFRRAMAEGGAKRAATTYSTANQHEWFAENFSAFVMGRDELVDPIARELIERIFNGAY